MERTSRFFRMAERPPVADWRGGNAAEDSFSRSMTSLVVAYAVDVQSNLLSGATPESAMWSEDSGRLVWSFPGTGSRILLETDSGSVLCKKVCLDGPSETKAFTHRWTPGQEGPMGWALAKLRYRSEDLELIPWDVEMPGWLCFGFRRGLFRS